MKKLMIAAAIAMMAVASQAYTVTWGAKNMFIPVATDPTQSQTGIVPTSGDKFGDTGKASLLCNLYWVDKNGEDQLIKQLSTTGAGVIGNYTISDQDGDMTVYNAMLADQGSDWKPVYHVTATYTTTDGKYTFDGTTTAGKTLGDLSNYSIGATTRFTNDGSWTYTANAVPEPTSGLLLLLGVAGLALRRRRA